MGKTENVLYSYYTNYLNDNNCPQTKEKETVF